MWADDAAKIKALAKEIVKQQREPTQERSYTPLREPPPPKPLPHMKFRPGSQEWFQALPKPLTPHEAEALGKCVMMRKPEIVQKLPRGPNQQRQQSNGWWFWWR